MEEGGKEKGLFVGESVEWEGHLGRTVISGADDEFTNSWGASGSRDLDVTGSGATTNTTTNGTHTTTGSGDARTLVTRGSYGVITTETTFTASPPTSSSMMVTGTPDAWLFPPLPIVGICPLPFVMGTGWLPGTTESLRWYQTPPLQQAAANTGVVGRAPTPWVSAQRYLIPMKVLVAGAHAER